MANKSKGFLGDTNIGVFKLGDSDVKLYLGDMLVYPLEPDFNITYDAATYNGILQTAQNIVVTDSSGNTLIENADYIVTENNGGINAGSYPIVITLMGQYQGTASTEFVISKVTPTVTAPVANVLTYNSSAQELVNAGSTDYGTLKYSIDGINYSTIIPSRTNAGNYTVYYKVDGNSNINDVPSQSIACSIAKADSSLLFVVNEMGVKTGGTKSNLVSVKAGDGVVSYSSDDTAIVTVDNNGSVTGITTGDTVVIANISATENYNSASTRYNISAYDEKWHVVAKFNVTDTTSPTKIAATRYAKIEIDGVEQSSGITSYTFSTTGEHVVKYKAQYNSTYGDYRVYGFESCPNLTSVLVSDDIKYIGEAAFCGCTNMETCIIGNQVKEIEKNVFENCSGLTSIVIPDSVTSIGQGAFSYCTSLAYCPISNNVTSIGRNAFFCCSSLPSIDIPDSVTSIGNSAFYMCSGATTATIGSGVTSIGNSVFGSCYSLTSVTIPDTVTSIGDGAFNRCSGLTSCTIGSGVTSIGKNAFMGCSGLTSLDLPDSLTSIGQDAFGWCTSLTTVIIGSGVTSIGSGVFYNCSAVTSLTVNSTVVVTEFDSSRLLQTITIGDNVTSIGDSAFDGCRSLTSVNIGSGVTSIGEKTFYDCTNLTSIDIPNSVTSIGTSAFTNCSGLTSCTIGSGVTSIGNVAFRGCTILTSIDIPSGVTSIGGSAFMYCSGLTSCTIGSGVTSIGGAAFAYCRSLSSITIPSGVTSIGSEAFSDCISLTSVTVEARTPPTLGNYGFSSTNSCPIYVQCESVDVYKEATNWSSYASRIQAIPGSCS